MGALNTIRTLIVRLSWVNNNITQVIAPRQQIWQTKLINRKNLWPEFVYDVIHIFQDVLRNVPLVSSLYNWWSPPAKDSHGIIGRSFDLSSGKFSSLFSASTTDFTKCPYFLYVFRERADFLSFKKRKQRIITKIKLFYESIVAFSMEDIYKQPG